MTGVLTQIRTGVQSLVGGQPREAPAVRARQGRKMFSSNGFRACTQRYQPGAGSLFGVAEKVFISDDYWTFAPRWLFANWYLAAAAAGGREAANTDTITIEAVSLVIGSSAPVRVSIAGSAAPYALLPDTEVWTDADDLIAIPPRTRCAIRVAWSLASATAYLVGPTNGLRPGFGDRGEVGASSLADKVMSGGISTTVPAGSNVYVFGPIAMVADGWDGRPVGLVLGTSIEAGAGQSRLHCNAFGETGPIGRGLTSTVGGAPRYAAASWPVPAGYAAGIIGTGAGQGLYRSIRAIAALGQVEPPMTFVYSGYGTNDQIAALDTWQGALTPMWAAIKSAWPDVKLIQSTLWPRVQATTGFTDVAGQSPQSSTWTYPTGAAWAMRHWMMAKPTSDLYSVIDVMDAVDNAAGGGTRGRWRVDVLGAAWASTLSAAVVGGAATATLASMPRAGSVLALMDGTAEAALINTVTGFAAPFSVAFNAGIAGAHAAGAAVQEAITIDGTHPGDRISAYVGDTAYAQAKIRGDFG